MKKVNFTLLWCCLCFLSAMTIPIQSYSQATLACNDNVQISLNIECGGATPDMFLEGGASPLPDHYELQILNQNGVTVMAVGDADSQNDPFTGIDWTVFIGRTVKYKIIACQNATCTVTNSCWGSATIEMNLSPVIENLSDITAAIDALELTCADLNQSDWSLLCGLPIPAIELNTDACVTRPILSEDIVTGDQCTGYNLHRRYTTTYTSHGELQSVEITTFDIPVRALTVNDFVWPKPFVELPCGTGTSMQDIYLAKKGSSNSLTARNNGTMYAWPYVENCAGTFVALNPAVCNLAALKTDASISLCGGSEKVLRTWSVIDWCNQETSGPYLQIISTKDTQAPYIDVDINQYEEGIEAFCGVEITGGDVIAVSTRPWLCTAKVNLPPPTHMGDACGNVTYNVLHAPGLDPFGVVDGIFDFGGCFIIAGSTGNESGRVTGNATSGFMGTDLTEGIHSFIYVAQDECGNKAYDTISVWVGDFNPPTPVCEDELVVSLTPDEINNSGGGVAKIFANAFDAGSHDAGCGDVWIKVIRMDELNGSLHGYWNSTYGAPFFPEYFFLPEDNPAAACDGANGDDAYISGFGGFFGGTGALKCTPFWEWSSNPDDSVEGESLGSDPVCGTIRAPNSGTQVFFDDHLKVCCEDFGTEVMVVVRVFDRDPGAGPVFPIRMDGGYNNFLAGFEAWADLVSYNVFPGSLLPEFTYNDCMVRVTIQDKTLPKIFCPPDATVDCEDSADLNQNPELGHATVEWTCTVADAAYVDLGGLDKCGLGLINRLWFYDSDGDGVISNALENYSVCTQRIQILPKDPFDPFSIKWPPHYTGVSYDGVNRECRTNGAVLETSATIGMPGPLNCADAYLECIPEWDDADCGLVGWSVKVDTVHFDSDGSCLKIIKRWTVIDWCVWEPNTPGWDDENDGNPGDDLFEAVEDWTLGNCDGPHATPSCYNNGTNIYFRYTDFDEDGYYTWDQVIKIVDDEAPVITGCDGGMIAVAADCKASLVITNSATDSGDCPSAILDWRVDIYDIHWNPYGTWYASSASGETVTVDVSAALRRTLPAGTYRAIWKVEDGCGNFATCTEEYMLADKKAPTPYCITNLSTAVMDVAGSVTIWASDFDKGSWDNCTAQSDLLFSFSGDEYDPSITITCDDIENGITKTFELEMWVWDEGGNRDYCYITLRVDDNIGICDDVTSGSRASIAGDIRTENNDMVSNAEVMLNSTHPEFPATVVTQNDGHFAFASNPTQYEYNLTAERNDDYMNGVSTLDLVLIQKHILGLQLLDSPYKVIAADINSDSNISASDLVELRKLILGVYNELPNNDSWRFVDAGQTFANNMQPFPFTEMLNINSLSTNMMNENFVAAKIGDVSNNAKANSFASTEVRSNGKLNLTVAEQTVAAGSTVSIAVSAENFNEVSGYQFTMNHSGLSLVNVTAGAIDVTDANVGVRNGMLTMSWNSAQAVTTSDDLFTLTFKANENVTLSNAISINSRVTAAEAYVGKDLTQQAVEISFRTEEGTIGASQFELYQNEPNPFAARTVISFNLPQAGKATLSIMDVTGKLVRRVQGEYSKGFNQVALNRSELGAAGILYYQLESGEFTATKKMIVIE